MNDLFSDFEETRILIDRSDLETCASCPMQMRLLKLRKRVVGNAANIGQEVHDAISRVVASYIGEGGLMSPGRIVDALRGGEDAGGEINFVRPDVQPAAIEALRPAVWVIANIIGNQNANNILRHDGGSGERTGQLAWDFNPDVRLTAEVDLLMSTESNQVLRLYDWKTGRGMYDIGDVKDAFQFQFYSTLILQTYPDVQRVDVVVVNTREGRALPPVHFYRSKLPEYVGRITTAVNAWVDNAEPVPLEQVAAWPSTEKCRLCDAAADCPAAELELSADPVGLLQQRIALGARLEAMDKLLQAAVTKQGAPIRTPDGDVYGKFGTEKPRETWKVKPGKGGDE